MEGTSEAVFRLAEALASEKNRATGLQNRLLDKIAQCYVNCGDVVCFESGLDGTGLRYLADKLTDLCGGRAAVFSGEEGNYGYCLAQRDGDLRELNKALTTALNGRGGGKPQFQQGTVRATRGEIEAFFAKV
jgi:alanyl-tRNA synthetase